jgi:hypothetical protein
VWAASSVKLFAENHLGGFLIAGDSAYPISTVLMKPYSAREAAEDVTMRQFNTALSGVRTVMTENVYARWKQQFPCLRGLRTNYDTSKSIIVATAILHNIGIKLGELEPEDDDDVLDLLRAVIIPLMDGPEGELAEEAANLRPLARPPAGPDPVRRAAGQRVRDELRAVLRAMRQPRNRVGRV